MDKQNTLYKGSMNQSISKNYLPSFSSFFFKDCNSFMQILSACYNDLNVPKQKKPVKEYNTS